MNYINIVNACSDLGVTVTGSNLGPVILSQELKSNKISNVITINKDNIKKSTDKSDLRKNEESINKFSKEVFDTVSNIIDNNCFPLTLGGDHSIVIGSALASQYKNKNLGVIWIDAHGDYNTFETTRTGNIHGLPFAAITGYHNKDLTSFLTDNFINPKNCVLVGGRSIDPWEIGNLIEAGITMYSTEDIKNKGAKKIMDEAISIASTNTHGIHISYDLDLIDPIVAPGVSVPEIDGINETEAYEIMNSITNNIKLIKSMDLVEYNPTTDIDDKTKKIALNLLNKFIDAYEKE